MIFIGDDWAEAHHDLCVLDESGTTLAKRHLPEGVEGVAAFHAIVADLVEEPSEVAIGIETDRGLFVSAFVAAGYQVYAINPLSASRYRDRHSNSGAKSDPGDAKMLADLVRTDRQNHRKVAGDTDLAEAIKILARGHQNLIWTRQRQTNGLRSTLREFYPAALFAFEDLSSADALSVLKIAPTPTQGTHLSKSSISAALKRGGRQRNINKRTEEIQEALRSAQLAAAPAIAVAFGAIVASSVEVIAALQNQIKALESELANHFEQHPDAEIICSLPGLSTILGARILGEFGDDPNRYADAKSRRNYAGVSPITRASGTRRVVLARFARNQRLGDACYLWAFSALTKSPGARRFYDRQRAAGASHHQALRALANHLVGMLHGCLRRHQPYDEAFAWRGQPQQSEAAA